MALMFSAVIDWDIRLFQLIFGWHGGRRLDRLMRAVTRSGDGYIWGVLGIALLFSEQAQGLHVVAAGVIGFAIHLPLYKVLKNTVSRPRPFDLLAGVKNLIAAPDRFSFPSGHTAAAFLMATLCAQYLPEWCWLMVPWSVVIAFSRVYLGVHFPLDVTVGAIWGMGFGRLGLWLAEQFLW